MFNLSAGPCALFPSVLERLSYELSANDSLVDVLHRGPNNRVLATKHSVESSLRSLLHVPDRFAFAYLNDGGSAHFSAIPMNYSKASLYYYTNGYWSTRAYEQAYAISPGRTHLCDEYTRPVTHPPISTMVHYCDNETVDGVCFAGAPEFPVPLIGDMSSSLLTKEIEFHKHACLYASCSKNLGGGGGSSVVLYDTAIPMHESPACPATMSYKKHTGDFYNTPNALSLRMVDLTLKHVIGNGGVPYYSSLLDYVSTSVYSRLQDNPAVQLVEAATGESRSRSNIVFNLRDHHDLFADLAHNLGLRNIENRFGNGFRISLPLPVLENSAAISATYECLDRFNEIVEQTHHPHQSCFETGLDPTESTSRDRTSFRRQT